MADKEIPAQALFNQVFSSFITLYMSDEQVVVEYGNIANSVVPESAFY